MEFRPSWVGLVAAATSLWLCGCQGGVSTVGSPTGSTGRSATLENALSPNSLVSNSLVSNSLVSNSLVSNSLVSNALADPSAQGDANRDFFRYLISCAFNISQTAGFSWTDGAGNVHNETYQGALGLAPYWADWPLDEAGQRWVTACLLARTNYYGISILISMRARSPAQAAGDPFEITLSEFKDYTDYEGAFWGNLFAQFPKMFSCSLSYPVPAYLEADERVCTIPEQDATGNPTQTTRCGFGSSLPVCSSVCATVQQRRTGAASSKLYYFYELCSGTDNDPRLEVITTALYHTH
ncbi:MAG TPA: hypothetical protein VKN99_22465 [Polyangia bacterium]|nr:hypothetical protein [Polyangia bacterium]